eukprot:Awhi_evm1s9316
MFFKDFEFYGLDLLTPDFVTPSVELGLHSQSQGLKTAVLIKAKSLFRNEIRKLTTRTESQEQFLLKTFNHFFVSRVMNVAEPLNYNTSIPPRKTFVGANCCAL